MSTNLRFGQLEALDWRGLGHRVGHIRLCGDLLQALIDWSTCPGDVWQPPEGLSEAEVVAAVHARLTRDPGFVNYKRSARAVLRQGMRLVLNPMHKKWTATISETLVRRFWSAMLLEFDTDAFPIDRVAFEAVNEPGNWNSWAVADRAEDVLLGFANAVHAAQPGRVLILPGEMGFPRCDVDGPAAAFVQSWERIASRKPGNAAQSLNRFLQLPIPVIGTFHFYDPRRFTHQNEHDNVYWDVAEGVPRVRAIFDAVKDAVPDIPLYVGEFGLDVSAIARPSDGARWYAAVRDLAQQRGFAWSLWTYFTSKQAVVYADNATHRLREWDCSRMVAAVFNYSLDDKDLRRCGGVLPFSTHIDEAGAAAPMAVAGGGNGSGQPVGHRADGRVDGASTAYSYTYGEESSYESYSYDLGFFDNDGYYTIQDLGGGMRQRTRRRANAVNEICADGRPWFAPPPQNWTPGTPPTEKPLPPCSPAPPPFRVPMPWPPSTPPSRRAPLPLSPTPPTPSPSPQRPVSHPPPSGVSEQLELPVAVVRAQLAFALACGVLVGYLLVVVKRWIRPHSRRQGGHTKISIREDDVEPQPDAAHVAHTDDAH